MKHKLRQEIDDECLDYLDKLDEIAYQDDYMTSYVQGVFSKLNAVTIDSNRKENLKISRNETKNEEFDMRHHSAVKFFILSPSLIYGTAALPLQLSACVLAYQYRFPYRPCCIQV